MHLYFLHRMLLVTVISVTCVADNTKYPFEAISAKKSCIVRPNLNGTDDTPAIIKAFRDCDTNSQITFLNETYHINSVMNTTGLRNVNIDIYGTLLWSSNISYWLNNSLPYGYQNQSSAWWLGGENINVNGFGYGTLDGNGQAWYDFVSGISNYPGRPQCVTIWEAKNSVIKGLRFVQSQMWSMTILHSKNIILQDIYVNSTSHSHSPARNTDGVDTIFSNNIHFDRWTVVNGDDSISLKANSTNIRITNCTFYNGLGIALGSIGQYKDEYETIENVTASNITFYNTLHAGYIKTWTGQQVGYPPNGGGGGLGYAKNISFSNFTISSLRGPPFAITQCTTFSGVAGDCNSSEFEISDLTIANISGTMDEDPIASFQCSAAAPCHNISMSNSSYNLTSGDAASGYECSNVEVTEGFNCTGKA